MGVVLVMGFWLWMVMGHGFGWVKLDMDGGGWWWVVGFVVAIVDIGIGVRMGCDGD